MTNSVKLLNGVDQHHQFESLQSLDMDYDMWAGQFQIMVPFAEMPNEADHVLLDEDDDESKVARDEEATRNAINFSHHGGGRSKVTPMPSHHHNHHLTQILDSEDVFLSLHPSDFESLNIAAANAGDDRRQQQWNTFFPKTIQITKGKDTQNNVNNNNNNNNITNNNKNTSTSETETLQQRLSEQVNIIIFSFLPTVKSV